MTAIQVVSFSSFSFVSFLIFFLKRATWVKYLQTSIEKENWVRALELLEHAYPAQYVDCMRDINAVLQEETLFTILGYCLKSFPKVPLASKEEQSALVACVAVFSVLQQHDNVSRRLFLLSKRCPKIMQTLLDCLLWVMPQMEKLTHAITTKQILLLLKSCETNKLAEDHQDMAEHMASIVDQLHPLLCEGSFRPQLERFTEDLGPSKIPTWLYRSHNNIYFHMCHCLNVVAFFSALLLAIQRCTTSMLPSLPAITRYLVRLYVVGCLEPDSMFCDVEHVLLDQMFVKQIREWPNVCRALVTILPKDSLVTFCIRNPKQAAVFDLAHMIDYFRGMAQELLPLFANCSLLVCDNPACEQSELLVNCSRNQKYWMAETILDALTECKESFADVSVPGKIYNLREQHNFSSSNTPSFGTARALQMCAQCNAVRYCCVSCQTTDWKNYHKLVCKKTKTCADNFLKQ